MIGGTVNGSIAGEGPLAGPVSQRACRSRCQIHGVRHATWFEQADQSGGWYADFVPQMSRFDFKLDVPEARIADYDGHGIGASLEVGYIAQTGAWRIEPKLRFTYLSSHVDGFVGADDLQVQSNDNERYRGRVRYGYRPIGPWAGLC